MLKCFRERKVFDLYCKVGFWSIVGYCWWTVLKILSPSTYIKLYVVYLPHQHLKKTRISNCQKNKKNIVNKQSIQRIVKIIDDEQQVILTILVYD
jgi:hypothetical protein